MADLISAARTQIGYALKKIKAGKDASEHLAKADAFLARTGEPVTITKVAGEPTLEWSGTFAEALARFLDAEDAALAAAGKPNGRDGAERGAMSRAEHIELATKLGVLDELGGEDFFGPANPGGTA